MPYRKTIFTDNEIYHVVNRGVNHSPIFITQNDYKRFINLIDFSRYESVVPYSHFYRLKLEERESMFKNFQKENNPYVNILAFCLMQNHYHLLLQQARKEGVQSFMRNFQNSYAKYFNTKHRRSGPLFQSAFKSIRVETDDQLSHVSRYIHLNPSSSYVVKINDLEGYKFSSLNDYLGKDTYRFIEPEIVLENFKSPSEYKEFIFNQAKHQRELNIIKHLTLENP